MGYKETKLEIINGYIEEAEIMLRTIAKPSVSKLDFNRIGDDFYGLVRRVSSILSDDMPDFKDKFLFQEVHIKKARPRRSRCIGIGFG